MSLITELKRRNVFRVGIAYVVMAWLMAQVADLMLEAFGAPSWVMKTFLAFCLVGFPFALVFAWAFELTPEGLKRESQVDRSASITTQTGRKLDRVIIVLLLLIAGYFIWEARFADSEPSISDVSEAESSQISAPAPAPEPELVLAENVRPSIAVLPFDNRSGQESDEYFVEGIHDDLLTNLARISALKVISRTSVNQYAETEKTIPEIAEELGVTSVMEGAVQRSGNTVRINVQLIDAKTDEHLWAEIYDRELTVENLFGIQSEISEAIAKELKAVLSPDEKERINARPTDSLEAYTAYLRGIQAVERRNSAAAEEAMAHFQQAVELDPNFAMAWTGIAYAAQVQTAYGEMNLNDKLDIQNAAIERALELDPDLAEAHLMKARVYWTLNQDELTEKSFIKALELNPNLELAHQWYAGYLSSYPAEFERALELSRKALELDPLRSVTRVQRAFLLAAIGRSDEFHTEIQRVLEQDPEFAWAYATNARFYLYSGRFDLAVHWYRKAFDKDPGNPFWLRAQVNPLLNLGDEEGVEKLRADFEAAFPDHPGITWIEMLLNIYRGNLPAALEVVNWYVQVFGSVNPYAQWDVAYLHYLAGDFIKAREALKNRAPELFDPEKQNTAVMNAEEPTCFAAKVLIAAGDEEQGQALVDSALEFYETELHKYVEIPELYKYYAGCYGFDGQEDQWEREFREILDHKYFGFFNWVYLKHPSLRSNALQSLEGMEFLNAFEKEMEVQLENLRRLEAEGD